MMMVLAGIARTDPFVYCSNEHLCELTGKTECVVKDILKELANAGAGDRPWIRFVFADGPKPKRIVVLLLRRPDVHCPVVADDELPEVERHFREQHREGISGGELRMPSGWKSTPSAGGFPPPPAGGNPPANKNGVEEERIEVVRTSSSLEITWSPTGAAADEQDDDTSTSATLDPETERKTDRLIRHAHALAKPAPERRGGRGHPGIVRRFAKGAVALLLDDEDYEPRYFKLGWRIVRGEVEPTVVEDALRRTLDGLAAGWVDNPGSYFLGAVGGLDANVALDETECHARAQQAAPDGPRRVAATRQGRSGGLRARGRVLSEARAVPGGSDCV